MSATRTTGRLSSPRLPRRESESLSNVKVPPQQISWPTRLERRTTDNFKTAVYLLTKEQILGLYSSRSWANYCAPSALLR